MSHNFAEDRYDKMPYRRCGRSGLLLPAISLGAWETFGGYRDKDVAKKCLYRAFDLGITHIDLANNYGRPPGNAEKVVGKIIDDMPRDELIISTKAGYGMWPGPYGDWGSKKYLVASLDQSLKRLDLDYVDIFYFHRFDPETPLEETLAALDLIVKQGKALYVGISNFTGEQYMNAVEVVRKMNLSPITIHQPYYNMLGREREYDLFEHTEREGTGVITFSPLAQGRLTDKYLNGVPQDSRASLWWGKTDSADVLDEATLNKLRRLNKLAQERGQSLAQMAIAWNLRFPAVTSVLIGASRVEQIEENVAALNNLSFNEDELRTIDAILQG